ncbi:multiple coagulation factor deficiency protein 2 homolog isoform X2 [Manduca sexta]|uniref:multiple coagulation factor deficiency protein 2 homolog isoform X2 n=1 Tax=Manduca sexta TaxID=7130 RepID=UPI0018908975|nr:multiple coagulation factor deficiency protein 2 homolog isoform X2 [Manduca sexta]
MRLEACLHLLLLLNGALGLRRGPHHPHGQSPVERRHHHYKPRGVDSLTAESEVLHDAQHLEEDNKVLTAETLAKMSPEELEFHYFSAHDFDKNSKLDGLELLKAVYHTLQHETDEPFEDHDIEPNEDEMDAYIALVDRTLESDDTDRDGYVSYAEYRAARAKNPSDKPPIVMAINKP